MLTYKFETSDHEAGYLTSLVERFMRESTPNIGTRDEHLVLDRITAAILGTRHIRLAGLPNPESQVMMRDVIRGAMARQQPIPILIASGPKKPGIGERASQIDLAEFHAIRTLCCLQQAVEKNYEPGLSVRIRMENATGLYIEGGEFESCMELQACMERYVRDFRTLSQLMSERPFIEIISELELGGAVLPATAKQLYPAFRAAWDGDNRALDKSGWSGGISDEWKKYLEGRNQKLHPERTAERHIEVSCKYLSMLRARIKLGFRGDSADWSIDGKHLEISFAPPLPHAPRMSTRVFYRTMPTTQTKRHIPYWRAKGFFRLDDAETLRGGLMHGNCANPSDFQEGWLTLEGGREKVTYNLQISADLLS